MPCVSSWLDEAIELVEALLWLCRVTVPCFYPCSFHGVCSERLRRSTTPLRKWSYRLEFPRATTCTPTSTETNQQLLSAWQTETTRCSALSVEGRPLGSPLDGTPARLPSLHPRQCQRALNQDGSVRTVRPPPSSCRPSRRTIP